MALAGLRIAFLGGGSMAEALAGGLLASGAAADQVCAADPEAARRERLEARLGIASVADNAEAVARADLVVLAVKPPVVPRVLATLRDAGADCARPLWISIAAGVTLAKLQAGLGGQARVVRAMPNTPALVGAGATGFFANAACIDTDRARATALFESVGIAWQAGEEAQLDAVTGLSGSGPAYVFALLEALTDAGAAVGLPREAAQRLAIQTALGAATLAGTGERSPAELRRQVATPGGTTMAGLEQLEARGFAEALEAAVAAATARAAELGRE